MLAAAQSNSCRDSRTRTSAPVLTEPSQNLQNDPELASSLSSREVSFVSSYGLILSHLLTSATLGANNLVVHMERRAACSWL